MSKKNHPTQCLLAALPSIDRFFIGAFPLNGSVFFLAAAIPAVAGLHYQILREEQYLLRQYGKAYHAYRRATPRYFGRTRHERIIHNRRVSDG